ncbi:MAG: hypothetical protein AAGA03_02855 [Planctomycetota bacterium]
MRVQPTEVVEAAIQAGLWFVAVIAVVLLMLWLLHTREASLVQTTPLPTLSIGSGLSPRVLDFEVPAEEASLLAAEPIAKQVERIDRIVDEFTERGIGDSRPASSASPGGSRLGRTVESGDIIPRHKRWQLQFRAGDLADYARQLDDLQMELAVLGGQVQGLDYISNLSGELQVRHADRPSEERRLYFSWKRPNRLLGYEQQLVQSAGLDPEGRILIRFIPAELEHRLAVQELQYAYSKGHEWVGEIAKTVFECQTRGDGCKFIVVHQRYRAARTLTPSGD